MKRKLKALGLFLIPVLIGLSSIPTVSAGEDSEFNYCHGATDFKGCMKAERDGSAEELRALKSNIRTLDPVTYWLVVAGRNGGKNDYGTTSAVLNIPMRSETECEAAGVKIMADSNIHGKVFEHVRYSCLKGK